MKPPITKIKSYLRVLPLLVACLFLWGCPSTDTPTTTPTDPAVTTPVLIAPEDNAQFVSAVALTKNVLIVGGKITLSLAVKDSAEQQEIAGYLSGFGHVYASYYGEELPTDAQFTDAAKKFFPTTAANYVIYQSSALAGLQAARALVNQYVPANATNKAAYVAYVLNALAEASYTVGDSVLKPAS